MALPLQYHIEAISHKESAKTREAHILKAGEAEWSGDFGNCIIRQIKTANATFRSWTVKINFPVRIIPAQSADEALVLFARQGAVILHRMNQKSIEIPASTIFMQSHPLPGQSISLPKKGIYQWLALRICEGTEYWDIQQVVPGLFLEKILGQIFNEISSGDYPVCTADSLMDLILQEATNDESNEPDFPNQLLIGYHALVEEMIETMILHMDEKFSVRKLSKQYHIHPSRLTGLFTKETGKTPAVYLRDIRLLKARQLLCEKTNKIQDVGLAVGYMNPGHFSKFFKSGTGFSPSRFRRQQSFRKTSDYPG